MAGTDNDTVQRHLPNPRYLLVMTATIVPAFAAGVKRADPRVRLEDYKQALRYWLGYQHRAAERILLLENSGADLSELRAIARDENPFGKPVEIIGLPAQAIPAGRNYGYTEMQMLDEGLAQSRLRQDTSHLVKVTGRLTFPNLGKALDMIEARAGAALELMVECRKLSFPRRGHDANTQMFACTHEFYDKVLRGSREEMNATDVRLLEHLIFRKVIGFRGKPGCYLRYPCNVDPVGYSGFHSRPYRTWRTKVQANIRAGLRVIAPWYWY